MKYVVVLPDGVADVPNPELGGKTPLQVARHPHMDWIAREGVTGWAHTIPHGFAPGSDVGCMSVFGYDPRRYHTGRAPLEAAAQGISLNDSDVAFRCNTVTVANRVLEDYSAGHIQSDDSSSLIKAFAPQVQSRGIRLYPGVSYRHIAVMAGAEYAKTKCTPPHDITGQPFDPHVPQGPGADVLNEVMKNSHDFLQRHPINQRLAGEGKRPANMLWFWGQGKATRLPPFFEAYGLRGACVSAVDIVRGIARLASIDVLQVPGITGYFDTDYNAKADHALKALETYDFVLVHVEPTDEAGHMGDVKLKIQAIEDTDRLVVGTLLEGLKRRGEPYAILVVCDHPTSTIAKTHIAEAVPFACYTSDQPSRSGSDAYNEVSIKGSSKRFEQGFELMSFFLNRRSV